MEKDISVVQQTLQKNRNLTQRQSLCAGCESQFDMAELRASTCAYQGLQSTKATYVRDRLLACVDQDRAGVIVHPQAVIFATKADMRGLVTVFPEGPPRSLFPCLAVRFSEQSPRCVGLQVPRLSKSKSSTPVGQRATLMIFCLRT